MNPKHKKPEKIYTKAHQNPTKAPDNEKNLEGKKKKLKKTFYCIGNGYWTTFNLLWIKKNYFHSFKGEAKTAYSRQDEHWTILITSGFAPALHSNSTAPNPQSRAPHGRKPTSQPPQPGDLPRRRPNTTTVALTYLFPPPASTQSRQDSSELQASLCQDREGERWA